MKPAFAISRSAYVALALSALVEALAWAAPAIRPITRPENGGELAALTAEVTRLYGNEDKVLAGLRVQSAALARIAWTADARKALKDQLSPSWRWELRSPEQAALQRIQPRPEDWTEFVALVTALGAKPGLVVESIEIHAEGAARTRRLTTVTLGLRFVAQSADVAPATASFQPNPPGSPAGISTKQNPQDKSP